VVQLEAFQLVLLRRPTNATSYDDATLERIQDEHVAFMTRLRDEGPLVTNGPVADQPDESLRGIAIYNADSLEDARSLAESDPAVRAGRLAVEIMTWFSPTQTMIQTGATVTIEDS
jgi:uncharacterized protein YciI